jgi:tellurium resistance protein TerD
MADAPTVSLRKGQNISLSKEVPGLKKIRIGLGWKERGTDGEAFDLDASLFMLNAEGRVRTKDAQDFCFYDNDVIAGGAIRHMGDEKYGSDGSTTDDQEQILVDLEKVPAEIRHLAVVITIYQARERKQKFGDVSRAFARIVNEENGREITRYDLTEDGAEETAMIIAEVYRNGAEWKFKAVAQGFAGGLYKVCRHFGVPADDDG